MSRKEMSWPPAKEWASAGLIMALLAAAFTVSVTARGYRLGTIPLIDPAGVIQVTAWDLYNDAVFRSGEFPLWNPYTGLGQPHLGSMQPSPFYPLKIVAYIVGGPGGHDLFLFLRLLLMGLGAFILLRSIGINYIGSVFGGMTFGFGGYSLWFFNLVDLNNQVLSPFLMVSFFRLARRWTPGRHAIAVFLVAADMLGGHPEGLFVSLLFSSLFALWCNGRENFVGTVARVSGAVMNGLIMASIIMLPFAEYYTRSWNFHFTGMGFLHLWPRAIIAAVSPVFSRLAAGTGWVLPYGIHNMDIVDIFMAPYSTMLMKAGFPYLGFTASIFALAGIFRYKRLPRAGGFFLAFFLAAAGLSIGLFPFRLLSFIPPFNVMNNAKFFFAEITFCLCMLSGMAVGKFLKRNRGIEIMLAMTLVAELALSSMTVKPYVPVDWNNSIKAPWADGLDLGLEGYRFQAGGYFLFPPNMGTVNGFSDIRSSDALFPVEYFDWVNRAGGIPDHEAIYDFYPRYFTRLNDRALSSGDASLMGVRYLVDEAPRGDDGVFKSVGDDGFYLYENTDACPRLFVWEPDEKTCGPEIEFRRESISEINAVVDGAADIVAFNELRYPGWIATLDGMPVEGISLDVPLQAYRVGDVSGNLKIEYIPASFRVGLWVSLVSGISMILFLPLCGRRRNET